VKIGVSSGEIGTSKLVTAVPPAGRLALGVRAQSW
jgi:hypothetical protein